MKNKSFRFRLVHTITEILMYTGITVVLISAFFFFGVIGGFEEGTIETIGEFLRNLAIVTIAFFMGCGMIYVGWSIDDCINPKTKRSKK